MGKTTRFGFLAATGAAFLGCATLVLTGGCGGGGEDTRRENSDFVGSYGGDFLVTRANSTAAAPYDSRLSGIFSFTLDVSGKIIGSVINADGTTSRVDGFADNNGSLSATLRREGTEFRFHGNLAKQIVGVASLSEIQRSSAEGRNVLQGAKTTRQVASPSPSPSPSPSASPSPSPSPVSSPSPSPSPAPSAAPELKAGVASDFRITVNDVEVPGTFSGQGGQTAQ